MLENRKCIQAKRKHLIHPGYQCALFQEMFFYSVASSALFPVIECFFNPDGQDSFSIIWNVK